MIKKLIAIAILLAMILIVYHEYRLCKTGSGGVFSKLCHWFTSWA